MRKKSSTSVAFVPFVLLVSLFLAAGTARNACAAAVPASAASASAASAAAASAPRLTPDQARAALDVLESPARRAQVENTLRAIAAAGALAAPASAPAAASAATAASGTVASAALQSNGLAAQLARQGAHWAVHVGTALRRSVAALLDVSSLRAWWADALTNPAKQAAARDVALALLATLLPAFIVEWGARRALRHVIRTVAARRRDQADQAEQRERAAAAAARKAEDAAEDASHSVPVTPAGATTPPTPRTTTGAAKEARGKLHAAQHWSLLRHLPRAALRALLRALPLVAFVAVASGAMSLFTTDGSPADSVIGSLIDIYVICRVVVIVGEFFAQPDAPGLRLLFFSDHWAVWLQRWIVRIVVIAGAGAAVAETAAALGLNEGAHAALMKAIALIAHVMIAVMILQSRKPVAAWLREHSAHRQSLSIAGNLLADAWAGIAVFVVMALWFVWALDVRDGYSLLLHTGGMSVAILIGARVASIVLHGALARLFQQKEGAPSSLVQQRAYRYYPLLRGIVSAFVTLVTVFLLLLVWGVDLRMLFADGTVGHRLASALATIAVAAVVALVAWEAINVAIERRLDNWTTSGDFVRAARLRTLVPMVRTLLFIVIALVVVLTGLSELGVNTGPLLAGASIFGVALGFGSQKLVQDFITGIFLLMENAMQVGDWVTLAGVSGTVEYLSIRTVRLRAGDGSLHTVPFSSVTTINNTNRGIGNAAVKVNIAYGEDVDRAVEALTEIGAALREDDRFKAGILSDFAFWGVDAVDGAAVTLAGQVQCTDKARWGVQREFNRRIADEFRARGIRIANPQRTVWVSGEPAKQGGAAEVSQPGHESRDAEAAQADVAAQKPLGAEQPAGDPAPTGNARPGDGQGSGKAGREPS
ncbi:mechanosensitive ion channel family protein [Paraburkholderia kururiensis]|uniref:mechanosensitive ion channel family protein n=1 Tax=Paraburkholderia kururiensis TaxID=984307 RepID=UPI0003482579|nr:mechanosensitive ion channel domain-containing protein [Paraburkholderia kururiensis]